MPQFSRLPAEQLQGLLFPYPSSASARSTAVRVTCAMERKNQFQNIASSASHVFLLRAKNDCAKNQKAITCPFASDRCVDVVKVGREAQIR